jgi:mono/diheme cytochrome c family protein
MTSMHERIVVAACVLAAAVLAQPYYARAGADTLARFDYLLNCAGCHQMDGRGSAGVPSLTRLGEVLAVAGGRAYVVRVPGVAQAPLSDERLAALLNWAVGDLGKITDFAGYSAAEVATLRADPLRAPKAERQRLLPP